MNPAEQFGLLSPCLLSIPRDNAEFIVHFLLLGQNWFAAEFHIILTNSEGMTGREESSMINVVTF